MFLQCLGKSLIIIMILLVVFLVTIKIRCSKVRKNDQKNVVIILGSGGHTTQMCELLKNFKFSQCNNITIISGGSDPLSQKFFSNYFQHSLKNNNVRFLKTVRTNEVKQSKITAIFTTLHALLYSLWIIVLHLLNTTHLISNGPGLCVPYFFIFWFLRTIRIINSCKSQKGIQKGVKLIFIESWCRVKTVSVTGKLIRFISDEFIMHWENNFKFAQYYGKII